VEEGFGGEKSPKRQGEFTNNFRIYTYTPQNIYMGHVSVFDKYLHWPPVSVTVKYIYIPCNKINVTVKIYIYTLQQDKCKCK
jgi:hypothetical protein